MTQNGYKPEGLKTSCTFDYISQDIKTRTMVLLMITVGFLIPFILTLSFYCLIHIYLMQHNRRKELEINFNIKSLSKNTTITTSFDINKKKRKKPKLVKEISLMRNSILAVFLFALTWTPYIIMSLLAQYSDNSKNYVTPTNNILPIILTKFSAILTPVLYVFTNKDFRKYLKKYKSRIFCQQ
jgi:r-opsin